MTTKTVRFEDLEHIVVGNSPDLMIMDDILDFKTVEQMSNDQLEIYLSMHGMNTEVPRQYYMGLDHGEPVPITNSLLSHKQALHDFGTPKPSWWNQKKEYTPAEAKYAKAIRKRQKDKANRKRARHG